MAINPLRFASKIYSQEETGKLLRGVGFDTDESIVRIAVFRFRHGESDKWENILGKMGIPHISLSSWGAAACWENWHSPYGETCLKIRAPRSAWEKIRNFRQFIREENIPDISQPSMAKGNDFAPLERKEMKARQIAKIEKRYRFAPEPTDTLENRDAIPDEISIALTWYLTVKDTLLGGNGLTVGANIDAIAPIVGDEKVISLIMSVWEKKGKPNPHEIFRHVDSAKAPPVSNKKPRIKKRRKIRHCPFDVIAHWGDMFQ